MTTEEYEVDRRQRFVELHQEGCFLMPNAWDAGSAKILASVGFAAVATTSAGIAFSLGLPDHDSNEVGRVDQDTMMSRIGEIVDAVDVPVSADLEEGYGEAPETVAATISMTLATGAAGGNIEDFTGDRSQPLYDVELAADRIRAARAAVQDEPFVLVGRADSLLVGGTLDDAIQRSNAYLAAGAHCAYVPGASDATTIGTLVRGIDGPLNVVMGLTGKALSLEDLGALGVRRVSVGGSIARAMYRHLLDAARELAERGTFSYGDDQISQTDLNSLFRNSVG